MRIQVNHSTSYTYDTVVPRLTQCMKLYPSVCENQKVLNWEIQTNHGKIIESHTDGLGHKVLNIFLQNFTGSLEIVSSGVVETESFAGVVKGLDEKVNPLCFLRETELTKPCDKIIELSQKAAKGDSDSISFCHRLNLEVANAIEYVTGSTNTSTSAHEALKQGTGVCQDFAHILISAARINNLPARYINGFLMEDTATGENSTHAWAEIYIHDLGWVGFDPSHRKCIDEKYIRISAGFDFADSSTIKGVNTNYQGNELLKSTVYITDCQ